MTDVAGIQSTIALVSGKWVLPVLEALRRRPRGYNELARAVDVDHKTLDRTLSRLRRRALVERTPSRIGGELEARMRYRLTDRARAMLTAIDALSGWWLRE